MCTGENFGYFIRRHFILSFCEKSNLINTVKQYSQTYTQPLEHNNYIVTFLLIVFTAIFSKHFES